MAVAVEDFLKVYTHRTLGDLFQFMQSALAVDVIYMKGFDVDGCLSVKAQTGVQNPEFVQHKMQPVEGLAGLVQRKSGVVVCEDYFQDSQFDHTLDEIVARECLRTFMVTAVKARSQTVGYLYAASRHVKPYDASTVSRFSAYAHHLSSTLAEQTSLPGTLAGGESPLLASEGGTASAVTDRQMEVLQLRSYGMSVSETAEVLDISEHTVRFHLKRLMRRLGCRSEVELMAAAFREGLLH